MKKRDERRFQAIVQEVYLAYLRKASSHDIKFVPVPWAEVHPLWKQVFYGQARVKLRELLRAK